MKLKDLSKIEIEAMSYDDLAYLILQENNDKMKITDLFKRVCKHLGLSNDIYESKIADFFELLSTDKKFVLLENGFWDLKEKHSVKIKIEEDEDDTTVDSSEELEDTDDEATSDNEENIFYEESDDDEAENDLKDLVVIDEDDEANSI